MTIETYIATDTKDIEPQSNSFVNSFAMPNYDMEAVAYMEMADENAMLAEQALPCIIETWSKSEGE